MRCIHCGKPISKSDDGSRWLHDDGGWGGYIRCASTVASPAWDEPSA